MIFAPKGRLLRLCRALERLVPRTNGLEQLGARPPDGGTCILRLTVGGGAESVLEVSAQRVLVTTRSGPTRRPGGLDEVVDRLDVDLSSGYGWNVASCESPDELAELLVRHMHRRVRDAGPHGVEALAG